MKLLSGKLPISDFILSGRVRSNYRKGGETVTAALVNRLSEVDSKLRQFRHKARIEYVIVATPGRDFRLKHAVVTPLELMENWDSLTIHTVYYATRQLNASLDRAFRLKPFNINIAAWFNECPKPRKLLPFWPVKRTAYLGGSIINRTSIINNFFGSDVCCICLKKTPVTGSGKAVACAECKGDGKLQGSAVASFQKLRKATLVGHALAKVCSDCNNCIEDRGFAVDQGKHGVKLPLANCVNVSCEVFHKRHKFREAELEAEAMCKAFSLL